MYKLDVVIFSFYISGLHCFSVSVPQNWFPDGLKNKPCGDNGSLGLLPMTISEEAFCACHLLNCDEGQG
jgi:hypothetical protein